MLSPTREAGSDDDVAELGVPVQDEISIWGILGEPRCEGAGPGVLSGGKGDGKDHLGVREGLGAWTPGSRCWRGSHRVEAALHDSRPGLQPGQVAADEAAQEGDVGAGGTQETPVPLIGVRRAAVVVAHLGGSRSGGGQPGDPPTTAMRCSP